MRRLPMLVLAFGLLGPGAASVAADQPTSFDLTIKDHRFEPAELHVPANKRIELTVKNSDPTPEEFESPALKAEKIIPGGSSAIVRLRAMKPGRYAFFGEYHEDTAKGTIVAE